MYRMKRTHTGGSIVEYIVPVAVIGVVVGLGALLLTDNGKLTNFLVNTTNSTLDNAKKLSINAGANPISSALAGSRKWLTQTNVFYTNDNNQTCIFFYCVPNSGNSGSSASTGTFASSNDSQASIPVAIATPATDANSIMAAAATIITNIVNSSAGTLSPAALETINSVISSATQTIANVTEPIGGIINPLVESITPTELIAQIIPQDVLETIVESNAQLADSSSGDQSSSGQTADAGNNLAALNDFLNNIQSPVSSSSGDTSSTAVETAGSAGDVNEIGNLISQVATQVETEAAGQQADPKLKEIASILKELSSKTVYNSGLAEIQKNLENHVNNVSGSNSYTDAFNYTNTYYNSYNYSDVYQTGGAAVTAINAYMSDVDGYTTQMNNQLSQINSLNQKLKDLVGDDEKYKAVANKVSSLVGDVNNINSSLNSQARAIQVGNNANSFTVNGIQYTNSKQTDSKGQTIGGQSSST